MNGESRRTFLKRSAFSTGLGLSAAVWGRRVVGANERIRLAFVGLGSRGSTLLRSAIKTRDTGGNAEIAAICDARPAYVKTTCSDLKRYKIPDALSVVTDTDWRAVVDNPHFDAVVLATPDHLHYPMALAAVETKKAVYCEKPLGYTIQECLDLVKAVEAAGVVFQTGLQWRFNAMYRNAKRYLDAGEVGQITMIRGQWHLANSLRRPAIEPEAERQTNWFLYREYSAGIVAQLGVHQIDIVNWFLGAVPFSVCGEGGINRYHDGRENPDNVSLTFSYPNGVTFSYTALLTNALDQSFESFLGVHGTCRTSARYGGYLISLPHLDASEVWRFPCERCDAQTDQLMSSIIPGSAPYRVCGTERYRDMRSKLHRGIDKKGAQSSWTLDALTSFLRCVREGKRPEVDVVAGAEATIPALMATIAIDERRTVSRSEFTGDR